MYTSAGYLKRVPASAFSAQARGGRGRRLASLRGEDDVLEQVGGRWTKSTLQQQLSGHAMWVAGGPTDTCSSS